MIKDAFLNFLLGDTFARWRLVSETFAIGRPILARQLLTTLSGGRPKLLRWTTCSLDFSLDILFLHGRH